MIKMLAGVVLGIGIGLMVVGSRMPPVSDKLQEWGEAAMEAVTPDPDEDAVPSEEVPPLPEADTRQEDNKLMAGLDKSVQDLLDKQKKAQEGLLLAKKAAEEASSGEETAEEPEPVKPQPVKRSKEDERFENLLRVLEVYEKAEKDAQKR